MAKAHYGKMQSTFYRLQTSLLIHSISQVSHLDDKKLYNSFWLRRFNSLDQLKRVLRITKSRVIILWSTRTDSSCEVQLKNGEKLMLKNALMTQIYI